MHMQHRGRAFSSRARTRCRALWGGTRRLPACRTARCAPVVATSRCAASRAARCSAVLSMVQRPGERNAPKSCTAGITLRCDCQTALHV